jgi:hypothetical protein
MLPLLSPSCVSLLTVVKCVPQFSTKLRKRPMVSLVRAVGSIDTDWRKDGVSGSADGLAIPSRRLLGEAISCSSSTWFWRRSMGRLALYTSHTALLYTCTCCCETTCSSVCWYSRLAVKRACHSLPEAPADSDTSAEMLLWYDAVSAASDTVDSYPHALLEAMWSLTASGMAHLLSYM